MDYDLEFRDVLVRERCCDSAYCAGRRSRDCKSDRGCGVNCEVHGKAVRLEERERAYLHKDVQCRSDCMDYEGFAPKVQERMAKAGYELLGETEESYLDRTRDQS